MSLGDAALAVVTGIAWDSAMAWFLRCRVSSPGLMMASFAVDRTAARERRPTCR
jgi:hypothetical protein